MARQTYSRYVDFIVNGEQTVVPYIKLTSKSSDKRYIYKVSMSRLDKVSQQYYGSPLFGWLILQANPQFNGDEWQINDGSVLTIPYPLVASLQDYKNQLDDYFFYYGR
jgi:hypothetical protein